MAASVTGPRPKSNGVHKNDTRLPAIFTEMTHQEPFSQKLHNTFITVDVHKNDTTARGDSASLGRGATSIADGRIV
jgi:hypothetical protein